MANRGRLRPAATTSPEYLENPFPEAGTRNYPEPFAPDRLLPPAALLLLLPIPPSRFLPLKQPYEFLPPPSHPYCKFFPKML